ncbi:hypothetical protein [Solemya pervernicosa gill symbiont]|uniref:hypothetical protein n=1 Tax=Solemya pervernicosa gill symbiont TaxID=642797 RepID=UPI0010828317|nr:hypothetical protein [Solemya pervernicosa gill symbiont]
MAERLAKVHIVVLQDVGTDYSYPNFYSAARSGPAENYFSARDDRPLAEQVPGSDSPSAKGWHSAAGPEELLPASARRDDSSRSQCD